MEIRAGIDIGGTFTDVLLSDGESLEVAVKVLTDREKPARGVRKGIERALAEASISLAQVKQIVHGTTVVTNALIERKGALTAFLTTRGFRDTLEIGKEHRYELYDVGLVRPTPLAPRWLQLEVTERTDASGEISADVSTPELRVIARELDANGVGALGISFLHSYLNPANELEALSVIQAETGGRIRVSVSHEVAPEIGEYERASTTVANAYVQGLVTEYLEDLAESLRVRGFAGDLFVMLSDGSLATPDTAARHAIRMLESGPAGGAIAAADVVKSVSSFQDWIAFDMGGTTAKLAIIENGEPRIEYDFEADRMYRFTKGSGLPIRAPAVDMIEIGAGGGSIAGVDELGFLAVGPESAGSQPGPACYGQGGVRPTVTDADFLLGLLDAETFAGGTMKLDRRAAEGALGNLARELNTDRVEVAARIHRAVNENMAAAARIHAQERGQSLGDLSLIAFGGAGPLHAHGLARLLGVKSFVIPARAGVMSSRGFLTATPAFEFVQPSLHLFDDVDWSSVEDVFEGMEGKGKTVLAGVANGHHRKIDHIRFVDCRFVGQGHALRIDVSGVEGDLGARTHSRFLSRYKAAYGRGGPNVPVEMVALRVRSIGEEPFRRHNRKPHAGLPAGGSKDRNMVDPYSLASLRVPLMAWEDLGIEQVIEGPHLIEEAGYTVYLGSGANAHLDEAGNLQCEFVS